MAGTGSVAELVSQWAEPSPAEASAAAAAALGSVRGRLEESGTRIAVVDDDPTGTQTVRLPLIADWAVEEVDWGLRQAEPIMAVLTNSRALASAEAVALNRLLGERLARSAAEQGFPLRVISRSDSTLRGHFPAETDALIAGLRAAGERVDFVVVCPAYPAAGRITVDGVHLVRVGDEWLPAGRSEYAADPAFGYRASRLVDWIHERAQRRVAVRAISLRDVRGGGPEQVAALLRLCRSAADYVVFDAASDEDLAILAAGVQRAEDAGVRMVHRTGPAFLSARAGQAPATPLSAEELSARPGHGLLAVGSFTALTSRQLAVVQERLEIPVIELDVPALLSASAGRRDALVGKLVERVAGALGTGDVALATSRTPAHRSHGAASLQDAKVVADALVAIVRAVVVSASPAWVVAKGGITSHDLAVRALGVRRGRVVGQLFPGQVSVWDPGPDSLRPDLRYVVFPGNVGDDQALKRTVHRMRGQR